MLLGLMLLVFCSSQFGFSDVYRVSFTSFNLFNPALVFKFLFDLDLMVRSSSETCLSSRWGFDFDLSILVLIRLDISIFSSRLVSALGFVSTHPGLLGSLSQT